MRLNHTANCGMAAPQPASHAKTARRHFLRQYEALAASRLFTHVQAAAVLRQAASIRPLQGLGAVALPLAAGAGAVTTTTTGDAGCTMITSGLDLAGVATGAGAALRTATFTGLTMVGGVAAFTGSATGNATATGAATFAAGRETTGATGAISVAGSGAGVTTTDCTGKVACGGGAEPAHPVNPSTANRIKLRIPSAPMKPRGHLSAAACLDTN
jgi:hypothetical protein